MRFILKICGIFLLSLLLIFSLVACGNGSKEQENEKNDVENSSADDKASSIVTGATDDEVNLDVNDIFGNDDGTKPDASSSGSSQSGNSSADNSSETSSGASSGSQSSSGSQPSSGSQSSSASSGNTSSGIDYEDPSVWTDPV